MVRSNTNIISLKKHWPLLVFVLLAVFANFLAGNKPIILSTEKGWSFPILKSGYQTDYELSQYSSAKFIIRPLIPYSPQEINLLQSGKPPLERPVEESIHKTHWLGTDALGRDLLSNIIYGFRTSLVVSMLAVAIALLIGLVIGTLAGFWHNSPLKISVLKIGILLMVLAFGVNALVVLKAQGASSFLIIAATIILLGLLVLIFSKKVSNKSVFSEITKRPTLVVFSDGLLMGIINLFSAMPAYFVLLALLAVLPNPGILSISLVLGLLMWTDIARLTRAEIIRLNQTNLSEATQALGYSPFRIMFKHLLPNAIQPALATIGFGIGGAILAEAFLSFIGIAPAEMISWGNLMAEARSYPHFWWLSVFPGLAVFGVILVFYKLAATFERNSSVQ
jgi:peptide/nickel transport system permease protein